MAETPNPEMRERLRALCGQITVAEDIDPEIQEELLTHMEDKLNAYLHGSEPVTEEDAYLLVREHFGDPRVVKALLHETYDYELRLSLGRRLAAVASVSLALYGIWRVLLALGNSFAVWTARDFPSSANWIGSLFNVANLLFVCLMSPIIWLVVRRWRQQLDQGERPWFLRWSTRSLILLVTGLALVFFYVPMVRGNIPGVTLSSRWASAFFWGGMGLAWLSVIAQSILWLWWCDRPPRTKRSLSYTGVVWALVYSCASIQGVVLTISESKPEHSTLVNLVFHTGQLYWSLGFVTSVLEMTMGPLVSFVILVIISWVARAIYSGAKAWRTRNAEATVPV